MKQNSFSKFSFSNSDYLTDALCANFAVPIRALTGEGPQCIDAILAGLTVMFVSLTLIDVCVFVGKVKQRQTCKNLVIVRKHNIIQHDRKIQCDCWGAADGNHVPLICTQQLKISHHAESCFLCHAGQMIISTSRFLAPKTQQLFSCEIFQIPTLSVCPPVDSYSLTPTQLTPTCCLQS